MSGPGGLPAGGHYPNPTKQLEENQVSEYVWWMLSLELFGFG